MADKINRRVIGNTNDDILNGKKCFLAGAGPGDVGLVTLRTKELIKVADVIIHDQLLNPNLLKWAKEDCELINAGKKSGDHKLSQEEINNLLIKKTLNDHVVLRLKGGDPFIFGRVREEIDALLEAEIDFELIPGVSSASSSAAYAGITLTDRDINSSLIIYSGHSANESGELDDLNWISQSGGMKAIYMGLNNLPIILKKMISNGVDVNTPISVISNGTFKNQQNVFGTFENIQSLVEKDNIKSPALIIIGDGVKNRFEYNHSKGVLQGKKIVVTRSRKQSSNLNQKLSAIGSEIIEYPVIKTTPPPDIETFKALVEDTHTYDWLIFTSPNGVESFFKYFYERYRDARSIGGARIAAVGPGTAKKILEYRIGVDLIPVANFTAESLVQTLMKETSVENLMILWVRGKQARRVVFDELNSAGAIVDEGIAYDTVPEDKNNLFAKEKIEGSDVDMITFASSLTAKYFFQTGIKLNKKTKIASIGPLTSKTLTKLGHPPDLESKFSNVDDFVIDIAAYYQRENNKNGK